MKNGFCLFGLFIIFCSFGCSTVNRFDLKPADPQKGLVHNDLITEQSILLSVQIPGGMTTNSSEKFEPHIIQDRLDSFKEYFDRILILVSKDFIRKQAKDVIVKIRSTKFESFDTIDALIVDLNQMIKIDMESMLKLNDKKAEIVQIWSDWTIKSSQHLCRQKDSFIEVVGKDNSHFFILTKKGWQNCVGWAGLDQVSKVQQVSNEIYSGVSAALAEHIVAVLNNNISNQDLQYEIPQLSTARNLKAGKIQSFFVRANQQSVDLELYRLRSNTSIFLPKHIGFGGIALVVIVKLKKN